MLSWVNNCPIVRWKRFRAGLKLDIISSLCNRQMRVYLHEFKSILTRGEGINEMG